MDQARLSPLFHSRYLFEMLLLYVLLLFLERKLIMVFFHTGFIFTPAFFGNIFWWVYGFIICNLFINTFSHFYLFQVTTKIHIPFWLYLVNFVIISFTLLTLSEIFSPIILALFIYLFVAHRQLRFTYLATNMILVYFIFNVVTAIIGPIILTIYSHISPQTLTIFHNVGTGPMILIELLISLPIIKRLNPLFRYYTKTVTLQIPVLTWVFNIFLLSQRVFAVAAHGDHSPLNVNPLLYLIITILYFIAMLLFVKITNKYFRWRSLAVSEETELQNLRTYTSHIESMYDDLRRFRHDYKNILLSLSDAIKTGEIKTVREIFDRVVEPTNSQLDDRTAVLSHLENIQDLEIKSIVYSKVIAAIDSDLDVTVEVTEPFKIPNKVKITDAIRIISILFDNAINGAKDSSQKQINFSLFTKKTDHYIVISNSTKESQIDLQKLNGNFHGVLRNRHSLGLRNLRIILANYPFIQHNCQSINHLVTQEIIIH